jgi:hypothetical protein
VPEQRVWQAGGSSDPRRIHRPGGPRMG